MSFVHHNIAPVTAPAPNAYQAYRGAIANLANAAVDGEDIDDRIDALANHFDMHPCSIQAEVDELIPHLVVN